DPIGIRLFNEFDLPSPVPFLRTFLTLDRQLDITKLLIIHPSVHAIFPAKSRNCVGTVFVDPADEIVCYADVKRSANATGQDVDPIASIDAHLARRVVTGSPGQAGQ